MDVNGAIEVMRASDVMGQIVARVICHECPELDEETIAEACASEIFLAAKDMKACAVVEAAQVRHHRGSGS